MPNLLKPTLREKNRYIAFEIISDQKYPRDEIVKAVWNSVLRFLGEKGASRTSLWIMDWDEQKQRGILKVNHLSVDDVKASLALMPEIKKADGNKYKAIYRTLTVSGTLKKVRGKAQISPPEKKAAGPKR